MPDAHKNETKIHILLCLVEGNLAQRLNWVHKMLNNNLRRITLYLLRGKSPLILLPAIACSLVFCWYKAHLLLVLLLPGKSDSNCLKQELGVVPPPVPHFQFTTLEFSLSFCGLNSLRSNFLPRTGFLGMRPVPSHRILC